MLNEIDLNYPITNVSDAIGTILFYDRYMNIDVNGQRNTLIYDSLRERRDEALEFLHNLELENNALKTKLIKLLEADQAVIQMADEEKKIEEEGKEEGESAEKIPSMSDTTLYGIRRVDNLPEFEGCGYKYILM